MAGLLVKWLANHIRKTGTLKLECLLKKWLAGDPARGRLMRLPLQQVCSFENASGLRDV